MRGKTCKARKPLLMARHPHGDPSPRQRQSGRSSGVEHDLAKVGVEGSNPFARSIGSIHGCRQFLASGESEYGGKSAGNLDDDPALRITGSNYHLRSRPVPLLKPMERRR